MSLIIDGVGYAAACALVDTSDGDTITCAVSRIYFSNALRTTRSTFSRVVDRLLRRRCQNQSRTRKMILEEYRAHRIQAAAPHFLCQRVEPPASLYEALLAGQRVPPLRAHGGSPEGERPDLGALAAASAASGFQQPVNLARGVGARVLTRRASAAGDRRRYIISRLARHALASSR